MKKESLLHLLVVITAMITLSSCSDNTPATSTAHPAVPVNVYTLTKESAVYFDTYPATVIALNQVELRAQVTGYISGIFFTDGQQVKKGQKLYEIDRQLYQATYDNAVANLNVAKANQDKAQQDATRYNDLLKKDAIARQIVDHAITDLQSAKMQVAAANANVAKAATDLKYAAIYAPFDGTIGISQVKSGTLVTANQTLLNTVSSNNPMAVDIAINQDEIPRFVRLQKTSKPIDSVFTLGFSDNTVYSKPGTISFIDRAVDPLTGTIKVRLIFPNTDGFLKDGMTCNVQVKNNGADSTFLIAPYKAVVEQLGEYFVFVDDNNKAIQHKVILGTRLNDKVIIKSGLQEGDVIITDGIQKLRDSSAIQVGTPKK